MDDDLKVKVKSETAVETIGPAKTMRTLLRLLRATQPVSRVELARRLEINRSTVTDIIKPLIASGIVYESTFSIPVKNRGQGRPPVSLAFDSSSDFFVGVNLGVRHSQVGLTDLSGEILAEEEFVTPPVAAEALKLTREKIKKLCAGIEGRTLRAVGVSVPGPTDAARRRLLYAPHLDWQDVDIASALKFDNDFIPVIVENDATTAAMYEARLKKRESNDRISGNFVLVRSGTGIGVGLVLDGEVYRGTGRGLGLAGEFGHMTIVAGGKPCVCGNRGCWERYASASSAASLYTGERVNFGGAKPPRFIEIVERAEMGEVRAQRTLEKLGEYLGIGIANIIMGVGIPRVIVSGRLVYGWEFIKKPLHEAISKSIVGRLKGWTVECGAPKGATLGGALEIAVDNYLMSNLKASINEVL